MKRSPLKRKRATKRRTTSPRCSVQRCSKPAKVQTWCNTHAMKRADAMARKIVMERDGACRTWAGVGCKGPDQWAHVHSRSYKAIRHDPRNAVVLCAGHHTYFTHHPLEWEQWCRDHDIPWDELRIEALEGGPSWSLAETLERLSA